MRLLHSRRVDFGSNHLGTFISRKTRRELRDETNRGDAFGRSCGRGEEGSIDRDASAVDTTAHAAREPRHAEQARGRRLRARVSEPGSADAGLVRAAMLRSARAGSGERADGRRDRGAGAHGLRDGEDPRGSVAGLARHQGAAADDQGPAATRSASEVQDE